MSNNPFLVLLLVVVIAIAAGFLFADNTHMVMQKDIAEAAMKDSVTLLATANAGATALAATNVAQATFIATLNNVLATQTAQVNACMDEKTALSNNLLNEKRVSQKAMEGKLQAEATATVAAAQASYLAATNTALNANHPARKPENQDIKGKPGQPQLTPTVMIVDSQKPSVTVPGDWGSAVLPTLGIGFFGAVVFASYRMLKMEEQPERRAHK